MNSRLFHQILLSSLPLFSPGCSGTSVTNESRAVKQEIDEFSLAERPLDRPVEDPDIHNDSGKYQKTRGSEEDEGLDEYEKNLVDELCSPANMIVRRKPHSDRNADSCPSLMRRNKVGKMVGWSGEVLFPGIEAPESLRRYCTYSWINVKSPPNPDEIDRLKQKFPRSQITADCQAVTPEADIISDRVGEDLRTLFHYDARRIDRESIENKYPDLVQQYSPVTIAVVDTLPHQSKEEPASNHGSIVMDVIRDFACPGTTSGDCKVDIQPYLGLPRDVDGTILKNGGYFGRQSDFARGIYQAIRHWRSLSDPGPLIVNLSAGWEPGLFGDHPDARASVAAVYDALVFARQQGALIIASAGNHNGIRCTEGALAPALWEDHTLDLAGVGTVPLVYAIGGLGPNNELMPGSRLEGRPRLFAPATHAVALKSESRENSEELTHPRTGTSMASAVVSGSAGLLWSYNPGLRADQIMDILYNSGRLMDFGVSDFGIDGGGQDLHRIDICAAFERMCGPNCGPQQSDQPLCTEPSPPPTIANIANAIQTIPLESSSTLVFQQKIRCEQRCSSAPQQAHYLNTQAICPDFERIPKLRLTKPQPGDPGCSDCTIGTALYRKSEDSTGHFTVRLTVDESRDEPLSVIVDATFEGSNSIHSYDIRTLNERGFYRAPALSSDILQTFDLPFPDPKAVLESAKVRMTFEFDENQTIHTEDPLIVY